MEKQPNKIFANCSQPLRISQCVGNQFRIAKFNSSNTLYLCEIRLSQNLSEISHCQNSQCVGNPCEFRNANFAMRISQCQFRNANFAMRISQCQFRNANFAMPISQGQFRNANFAMPISQGQYTVHLSHIKHQNLSEISHCEIRKPLCEIRKPIAKFANHFANFTSFAKFTFAGLVILCN